MNTYTQGPWFYATEGNAAFSLVEEDGTTIMHMTALLGSTGASSMEANMQLIVAAPDLLEALVMVMDDPDALWGRPRTYEIVRAAISKALRTQYPQGE